MKIDTTRFGCLDIVPDDLLQFPAGLLGLEDCRHWVLLADAEHMPWAGCKAPCGRKSPLRWFARGGLCRSIRCGFCAVNCRHFA